MRQSKALPFVAAEQVAIADRLALLVLAALGAAATGARAAVATLQHAAAGLEALGLTSRTAQHLAASAQRAHHLLADARHIAVAASEDVLMIAGQPDAERKLAGEDSSGFLRARHSLCVTALGQLFAHHHLTFATVLEAQLRTLVAALKRVGARLETARQQPHFIVAVQAPQRTNVAPCARDRRDGRAADTCDRRAGAWCRAGCILLRIGTNRTRVGAQNLPSGTAFLKSDGSLISARC